MTALLDAYVPHPDARERHTVVVRAAPAVVWEALDQADLAIRSRGPCSPCACSRRLFRAVERRAIASSRCGTRP
jgi:hypothetical protein